MCVCARKTCLDGVVPYASRSKAHLIPTGRREQRERRGGALHLRAMLPYSPGER